MTKVLFKCSRPCNSISTVLLKDPIVLQQGGEWLPEGRHGCQEVALVTSRWLSCFSESTLGLKHVALSPQNYQCDLPDGPVHSCSSKSSKDEQKHPRLISCVSQKPLPLFSSLYIKPLLLQTNHMTLA